MSKVDDAKAKRSERDSAAKDLEELHREMVAEFDEAVGTWRTHANLDMLGYAFEQNGDKRPSTAASTTNAVSLLARLSVMFPPRYGEDVKHYVNRLDDWFGKLYRSGVRP